MGCGIEAMVWCAQAGWRACRVRSGACRRSRRSAFVLMVAGGLWCALVEHALAAARGRADRARAGAGAHGTPARRADRARCGAGGGARRRRQALGAGRPRLELRAGALARARRRRPAARGGREGRRVPLRRHGCTARVKGMLLAVADSPAALRDDCAAAAILVLKFARPGAAARRGRRSTPTTSPRKGAHALTIEGGRVDRDRGGYARRPAVGGATRQ